MSYQHLLVETDGPFTTITLNLPEKRNALALPVMVELTQAFRDVAETDATGVILAANGPVFSAGHNFGDMAGASLHDVRHLFHVCTEMMDTVQAVPQVVIARVHALATAAGCQLVATCDLAIAAESAGFAIPGGKGGLFCHTPLVAVARNIGRKRALEMALTGDPISAEQAHTYGLVSRITEPGGAVEAALALAERIARNAPLSVAASKTVIRGTHGMTEAEAWAFQRPLMASVFTSDDAKEGPRDSAEKRAPNWSGR